MATSQTIAICVHHKYIYKCMCILTHSKGLCEKNARLVSIEFISNTLAQNQSSSRNITLIAPVDVLGGQGCLRNSLNKSGPNQSGN